MLLFVSCAARLHVPSILLASRLADGGEVELMYVICRGEATNAGIASYGLVDGGPDELLGVDDLELPSPAEGMLRFEFPPSTESAVERRFVIKAVSSTGVARMALGEEWFVQGLSSGEEFNVLNTDDVLEELPDTVRSIRELRSHCIER